MNRAREIILKWKCRSKGHVWSKLNTDPRGIVYQHCKRCRVGRVDFKLTLDKSESTIKSIEMAVNLFVESLKSMEPLKSLDFDKVYLVEVDCRGHRPKIVHDICNDVSKTLKKLGITALVSPKDFIQSVSSKDNKTEVCNYYECSDSEDRQYPDCDMYGKYGSKCSLSKHEEINELLENP